MVKQAWHLHINQFLLCFWILKGIYFLEGNTFDNRAGGRPSWLWNSIRAGASLLSKGLISRIGNGFNTNICQNAWIPDLPQHRIFSLSPHSNPLNTISNLIFDDTRTWNHNALNLLFFPTKIAAISKIPIALSTSIDKNIWLHANDRSYSISSGYHFLKKVFVTTQKKKVTNAENKYP